jgi:hypothetical protein
MGNTNCGCATKKVGGKRVKRGGMSCNKTRKHKHSKKGGSSCHKKHRSKKGMKMRGGCGCGSQLMSGGYKYDRRSSVEAVKRLKKRVSKNTKSKSKVNKKYKKASTKRKARK